MKYEAFIYPEHDLPLSKKDKNWHLQWCKAMFGNFTGANSVNWCYNSKSYYQYLRQYATGTQPIQKYKDKVDCTDADNKSINNLFWDIIPIIPKFLGIIETKIVKTGYEFNLKRIDSIGVNEKRDAKAKMQAQLTLQDFLQNLQAMTGTQLAEQQSNFPADLDELEYHFEVEYKDALAMGFETAIKLETEWNNFRATRELWAKDVVSIGIGGYKTYTDGNGSPRIRYVKPDNIIVSTVQKKDFSDMVFVGETRWLTYTELIKEAGDKLSISEKDEIRKKFGIGNMHHSYYDFNNSYQNNLERNLQVRQEQRMEVIDCEWYSVDSFDEETEKNEMEMKENEQSEEKETDNTSPTMNKGIDLEKREGDSSEKENETEIRPNEKGNKENEKAQEGKGNNKADKQAKPSKTTVQTVHKATWVVGTEIVFNYGLANDMVRTANNPEYTKLSYHLFAPSMNNGIIKSPCEMVMAQADLMQIAFLKMQQAIQAINPHQIEIDLAAISDLTLDWGGGKITPMQVIELYMKEGVAIKDSSLGGVKSNPNQGRAFQEIPTTIHEKVIAFTNILNTFVELTRQILGVNEITDASTPDTKLGLGVSNNSIAATNDALFYLYTADEQCCLSMVKDLVERITMNIKYYGGKRYVEAMGDDTIKFIRDNADQPLPAFGIMAEKRMTDQEREIVIQMAQQSIQAQQIDITDFFAIQNCMTTKQAQAILNIRMKRKQKLMEKMQQQQMEQNAQIQQQAAQAAEQAKVQAAQMLLETEIAKAKEFSAIKMAEMDKEYELKGKLELLQRQTQLLIVGSKGEIDKDIAEDKIEGDLLKADMQGQYDTALNRQTLLQKQEESKNKPKNKE